MNKIISRRGDINWNKVKKRVKENKEKKMVVSSLYVNSSLVLFI